MMLFKACPHCLRGDLVVERERGRVLATCLQCGYAAELHSIYPTPHPTPPPAPEREKVRAA